MEDAPAPHVNQNPMMMLQYLLLFYIFNFFYFQDEKHKPRYHIIGKDVCMGDHKVNNLTLQVLYS